MWRVPHHTCSWEGQCSWMGEERNCRIREEEGEEDMLLEGQRTLVQVGRTLVQVGRTLVQVGRTLVQVGRTLVQVERTRMEERFHCHCMEQEEHRRGCSQMNRMLVVVLWELLRPVACDEDVSQTG